MQLELDLIANAAYFEIFSAEVASTKEIAPGILADYAADGHLIGLEILSVSQRTKLPVLDKVA
ncbi:DUF2283 domain-containing protein [Chromatium okenii]|jgi:uncharacterized protein YuzE|uniref:DUF2283 domain-containing protein n=1 Tax=Chromatium okenii TaxID=61644 RepID=UPI0026ED24CC|nr:DUF2283 domain-containing protein [Chromatium okenii]MBV5310404.1 DUF2283 domain-containing protein [Chromatium okenii]